MQCGVHCNSYHDRILQLFLRTWFDEAQGDECGWLQRLRSLVNHQHIKQRALLQQLATSSTQRAQLQESVASKADGKERTYSAASDMVSSTK
jgi:hypothetical protein